MSEPAATVPTTVPTTEVVEIDTDAPAGFLAAASFSEHVEAMYRSDVQEQGYVANLTRVWAHAPEGLGALTFVMQQAMALGGLDDTDRAVLTTVAAATMRDSYCSLAFGRRFARRLGDQAAARAIAGDLGALSPRHQALARWARLVAADPSATAAEDVDALRAAGFADHQVFGVTMYVAARLAFATVNDALGAAPDVDLAARTPPAVRAAVDFGRAPEEDGLPVL